MIKKHWKLLVITSVLTLLPILAGLVLWGQLPEKMPTHWNAAGEIDGWSSKAFAVFGLPGIMLAVQWLCVLGTNADPKRANHPEKVLQLVLWIIPVLSIVMHTMTYAAALGKTVPMGEVVTLVCGVMFVIVGNYMPKCKQNYTIGIKIPWTLNSEVNWNKTHRFAGWLWTVCGLMIILSAFVGGFWLFLPAVIVMVAAPMIYSYMLFKKGE